jgi:hypothetical protein
VNEDIVVTKVYIPSESQCRKVSHRSSKADREGIRRKWCLRLTGIKWLAERECIAVVVKCRIHGGVSHRNELVLQTSHQLLHIPYTGCAPNGTTIAKVIVVFDVLSRLETGPLVGLRSISNAIDSCEALVPTVKRSQNDDMPMN